MKSTGTYLMNLTRSVQMRTKYDRYKNTTKLFSDKCSFRNIAYIKLGTKDKLGLAIGKSPRAVLGIKNKNFADQILRLVEEV